MGISVFDTRQVIGMNPRIECACQTGLSSSVQFFKVVPEEFAELLQCVVKSP